MPDAKAGPAAAAPNETAYAATPAAIALLVAAALCFVALDSTTKTAIATLSVWMVVWARYAVQLAASAAWLMPQRGWAAFKTEHPRFQLLRGLLLTAVSLTSMVALRYMPVGEFTAIVMLTPLVVSAVAVKFFGERLRPVQWVLLLAAFAGALVIIRPGGDLFGWYVLIPLFGVVGYAAFQLLTRRLAQTEEALVMHMYTGLVGTVSTAIALPWVWRSFAPKEVLLMLMAGFFGTLGHYLLIKAYARASASALAPVLYAQVPLAVLASWLVFNHQPDLITAFGIAVVVASGAGSVWAQNARPAEVQR